MEPHGGSSRMDGPVTGLVNFPSPVCFMGITQPRRNGGVRDSFSPKFTTRKEVLIWDPRDFSWQLEIFPVKCKGSWTDRWFFFLMDSSPSQCLCLLLQDTGARQSHPALFLWMGILVIKYHCASGRHFLGNYWFQFNLVERFPTFSKSGDILSF